MSFSYSNTLSAKRDQLRFLLRDTTSATAQFADEELDGILLLEPNLYLAAALLARQQAAVAAANAISYRVGSGLSGAGVSVDRTKTADAWTALAKSFEEKAAAGVEETFDRLDFTIDHFGIDRSEYQGVTYEE